jgi:cytochrome c oxidase subunit 4
MSLSEHAHAHALEHGPHHILPVRTYLIVYIALLLLLIATVGAAFINVEPFNFALTMIIAVAKAAMILLVFMHVRYSERLVWVFSTAAFLWLAILIALSLNDYFTRDWLHIPGK